MSFLGFSGTRQEFQTAASEIGYELEKELGTPLLFTPSSGAAYTVYGIPWSTEKSFEEMIRLKIQHSTRKYTIHAQGSGTTAFPPPIGGIRVNNTLYNQEDGITYQITKVSNPDSLQSEWLLETKFDLPRQVGDIN